MAAALGSAHQLRAAAPPALRKRGKKTLKASRAMSVVRAASTEPKIESVAAAVPSDAFLPDGLYCVDNTQTIRRKTRTVTIGNVKMGSDHPIVRQTMTTSDTRDVEATVAEVKKCADAGAEMVRITVQGMQEAKACAEIKKRLVEDGYDTPLIADIHFAPKVAMMVAECFDKIRVNPGNFADGRKKFEDILYETDEEYNAEIEEIEKIFTPLVLKCKERGVAMRIGTNHGSLSARTLSRYGDTPAGMVESAFEFARICRKHDYHNFVFSMKASNPLVMVQAYRLLAHEMYKLGWDYPLHLGVTEAGEGEDGRMKSSIGIGALLLDGLGDTIRVSLTEASHLEMEPCTRLRNLGHKAAEEKWGVEKFEEKGRDFKDFARRASDLPVQKEDDAIDLRNILHRDGSVLSAVTPAQLASEDPFYRDLGAKLAVGMPLRDIATSDSILLTEIPAPGDEKAMRSIRRLQEIGVGVVADAAQLAERPVDNAVALVAAKGAASAAVPDCAARVAVVFDGTETTEEVKAALSVDPVMALIKVAPGVSRLHASRRLFTDVLAAGSSVPVIHHIQFTDADVKDDVVIQSGSQVGGLLCDGLGDGVLIEHPTAELDYLRRTSFGLLQGSRMRNTKTEYVSCPSCGRTLFDLQEVTAAISERTGHLPGVAIAVMGCIVNGPGEMADADFGYVGGAPGKIDLYVGKEVVKRGIDNDTACDELIQLIKDHGRWVDKEEEEEAVAA